MGATITDELVPVPVLGVLSCVVRCLPLLQVCCVQTSYCCLSALNIESSMSYSAWVKDSNKVNITKSKL